VKNSNAHLLEQNSGLYCFFILRYMRDKRGAIILTHPIYGPICHDRMKARSEHVFTKINQTVNHQMNQQ